MVLAGLSNDPMAEYSLARNLTFNAAAPAYLAYVAKKAKVKRYGLAQLTSEPESAVGRFPETAGQPLRQNRISASSNFRLTFGFLIATAKEESRNAAA